MSFYDYWHEKQVREAAEVRVLVEQAQGWIGCRVWIAPTPNMGLSAKATYGEVESIDERGEVKVLVGYDAADRPHYYTSHVTRLGRLITRATE
jgi:hypothetical protein